MRELLPGGVSTDLTADRAADTLRRIRLASPVERVRKELAWELVAEVRALDTRLKANQQTQSPNPAAACSTSSASARS